MNMDENKSLKTLESIKLQYPIKNVNVTHRLKLSKLDKLAIFVTEKIGISSVLQPEGHGAGSVPLVFLLESASASSLQKAVSLIGKLPNTRQPAMIMRVEDLT
jgi:hypothetical protein